MLTAPLAWAVPFIPSSCQDEHLLPYVQTSPPPSGKNRTSPLPIFSFLLRKEGTSVRRLNTCSLKRHSVVHCSSLACFVFCFLDSPRRLPLLDARSRQVSSQDERDTAPCTIERTRGCHGNKTFGSQQSPVLQIWQEKTNMYGMKCMTFLCIIAWSSIVR